MDTASILRVERLNYAFGGLLCIGAAVVGTRAQALGVVIGVILTCLNFFFLRRLVFKWTAEVKAGAPSAGNRMFLILPKMLVLMGAVVVSILFLPLDAIAFLIGYSIFIVSIVVGGIIDTLKPVPSDDGAAHDANKPS